MIDNHHPSDSTEQKQAEKVILNSLSMQLSIELKKTKLEFVSKWIEIDGYSENSLCMVEIFSHIGKLKSAQKYKVMNDILKMLLIEKMQNKTFRKIIAFADEEAAKSFSGGKSWYSKLKDNFNIEILVIDIPSQLKESLINAQKRQYR